MTRRRGMMAVQLLVALPLAGLALGAAWLAFHTGSRQGAATAALTDLLIAEVRIRAQLEVDLGSLVTDGDEPACALSADGLRLELRVLAPVPHDASARLAERRVIWSVAPARPSGVTISRGRTVLSPRPLARASFTVSRRERILTVRLRVEDAGRAVDVACVHQAPVSLPGLVEVIDGYSSH